MTGAGELKKTLGLAHLFAMGMGTTIGVGWIVVVGGWIADAGPVGAAGAFGLGAILMLLVGFAYADLAQRTSVNHGDASYVGAAFGKRAGFAVGWMVLLGFVAICAFEGLALAWLLGVMVPEIVGPTLYVSLGSPVSVLDAATVVGGGMLFVGLNLLGAREAAWLQLVVTIGKIALGITFIVIGVAGGNVINLPPLMIPMDNPFSGVSAVLVTIPAWFCGFNALLAALGEARISPRASTLWQILAAVIVTTALFYIGVIFATAMAVPRAALEDAALPAVTAVERAAGLFGSHVVLVGGAVALLSAWNAALFGASRMIFQFARSGDIPSVFGGVYAPAGTPAIAIMFVGGASLAGGLLGRAFLEPLIQLGAAGFAFGFLGVCLASTFSGPSVSSRAPIRLASAVAAMALALILCISIMSMFSGPSGGQALALLMWAAAGVALWCSRC